jgi:hypothetical protein
MSDLLATLSCSCGRSVFARARDAGGRISCECGNNIAVPNLSQLRILAGADAFVTNPAELIRKLQAEGKNPAGKSCLNCGSASPQFYDCHAVCESSHIKAGTTKEAGDIPRLLSLLFLPKLILFLMLAVRRKPQESEIRGHDIEVSFKIPICSACAKTIGDVTRPKTALQVLSRAPVLAKLIAYYPQLQLQLTRPVN